MIAKIIGIVILVIGTILKFLEKYKDLASQIALRIEKDTKDGTWSNEEKEQLALWLWNEKIRPTLPWYFRLIPSIITTKLIRYFIRRICRISKKFKTKFNKTGGING